MRWMHSQILLISNRISGVVPQIAVVAGACVGSAALVAANADITVAVDGADYYLKPDEREARRLRRPMWMKRSIRCAACSRCFRRIT